MTSAFAFSLGFACGTSLCACAVALAFRNVSRSRSIFERSPWDVREVARSIVAQISPKREGVGGAIRVSPRLYHAFPSLYRDGRKEFGR